MCNFDFIYWEPIVQTREVKVAHILCTVLYCTDDAFVKKERCDDSITPFQQTSGFDAGGGGVLENLRFFIAHFDFM